MCVRAWQDLLKHTPKDHPDFGLLQDALRISQNFLSSINEEIDPRRTAVTTPKGEVCERERVAFTSNHERVAWMLCPATIVSYILKRFIKTLNLMPRPVSW